MGRILFLAQIFCWVLILGGCGSTQLRQVALDDLRANHVFFVEERPDAFLLRIDRYRVLSIDGKPRLESSEEVLLPLTAAERDPDLLAGEGVWIDGHVLRPLAPAPVHAFVPVEYPAGDMWIGYTSAKNIRYVFTSPAMESGWVEYRFNGPWLLAGLIEGIKAEDGGFTCMMPIGVPGKQLYVGAHFQRLQDDKVRLTTDIMDSNFEILEMVNEHHPGMKADR